MRFTYGMHNLYTPAVNSIHACIKSCIENTLSGIFASGGHACAEQSIYHVVKNYSCFSPAKEDFK